MSLIIHPATGFAIGDPERLPLDRASLPTPAEIGRAVAPLILSASGWRKVFALPASSKLRADTAARAAWAPPLPEGFEGSDEDSLSEEISAADVVLAGAMALVFYDYAKTRSGKKDPAILLGMDSRPTGPAIADAMCRVLVGMGARPRYLFIVAAPEIMASTRACRALPADNPDRVEGFIYVSASHNPPAHNGVKFGTGGGVLSATEVGPLIEAFKSLVAEPRLAQRILGLMEAAPERELARVYADASRMKRRSISDYTLFAREVVTGRVDPEEQEALLAEMAETASRAPVGVVAELNGSARSISIDANFLEGLGVKSRSLNAAPRAFAHRIVPEGESLEMARRALDEAAAEDPSFVAGYVPDCDGDRGNLVIRDAGADDRGNLVIRDAGADDRGNLVIRDAGADDRGNLVIRNAGAGSRSGSARVLEAQEVFALCCAAELAALVKEGKIVPGDPNSGRAAIAVNDGTSMRVEAIARVFGAQVFRAETGEPNVVGLASSLRERGYIVRILGEGSNGGNITHPSAVRDPLATLGALLKFLLLRDRPSAGAVPAQRSEEGLFRIWMGLSGRLPEYRPDFSLGDIVASLPRYATTSVFEQRAALKMRGADQVALKARYRAIFLREWPSWKPELERRYGIVEWRALASKGISETDIGDDFASSGKGGLRILLRDANAKPRAFLWMRGSGTEPVFRVMVDIEGGGPADEEYLLAKHTAMLREADE